MNITYLIPIVCFWHTISTEISKYKHELLSNNIISFMNCLLFIYHHNNDYNLEHAVHIGIGFYIYDLLYIFSRIYKANANANANANAGAKEELNRQFPFIIHHLAGIYILNASITGESQQHILYAYNILEKSNIMIYVSYYLHKQYAQYVRLNTLSEFLQLLSYSYFRLFQLLLYIYNNRETFFQFQFMTQFLIIAIYCMGLAWSHRLLKRNIANFYIVRSPTRSMKYSSDG